MHNSDAIHSLKTDEIDYLGRPVRTLRMGDAGALRLEDVLLLAPRESMNDVEAAGFLAHARLTHAMPQLPLESLLHAFIPHAAVMQSHPDAIAALTHTPAGEKLLHDCFGDAMIVLPQHRFLLQLAKNAPAFLQSNPAALGLVLINGDLVTWGADVKEATERHAALVKQAEKFVQRALEQIFEQQRDGREIASFDISAEGYAARRDLALKITPILRGLLSEEQRVVLRYDNSTAVLMFLAQPEAQTLLQRTALWLDLPSPELAEGWEGAGVGRDEGALRAHLEQHLAAFGKSPRVIVMPHVGLWTAGADLREATRMADDTHHAFRVMTEAQWLGGYVDHAENLSQATSAAQATRELSGRIALVTGAANGIGRDIALRLAAEGAHVVVTDIDLANAQRVADEIVAANGEGRAIALALDVSNETQVQHVFDETVLRYGGLDVLVSNAGIAKVAAIADLSMKDWSLSLAVNTTGHFLVSRAAMRVLLAQHIGGSLVFNATKNVTAPGKDFGAYSVAKAGEAQLCRILAIEGGPARIRANMVNPDAVLSSNLWSPEIREKRAKAQGIPVNQLEDFYKQRNLLKTKISGEDVAEAVFWFASDRSSKTTGAMIPVDGGVREAFPR